MYYEDFELEIDHKESNIFSVAVIRSPAGETRSEMTFAISSLLLENRLLSLQNALLQSSGTRRRIPTNDERIVQEFGQELFDKLIHGEIRNRYDVSRNYALQESRGLRLKLRIKSAELAVLPWEFMFDSRTGEYICLSRDTPVIRYLELARPIKPLEITTPLRILAMIASPTNSIFSQLDVTTERERVNRAVRSLKERGVVDLVWLEGQTWRDLQLAMRRSQWHIFHFVGHGSFDRTRDEGQIVFADRLGEAVFFSATNLARLLGDHRSLRLVVLNSCEGARGSTHDIFSSTAATLIRSGIPAALAMQYEITDSSAIEFSETFYEAIADGVPVDAAVSEARKSISFYNSNSLEWGIPVVFTRAPDGVLFKIKKANSEGKDLVFTKSLSLDNELRTNERLESDNDEEDIFDELDDTSSDFEEDVEPNETVYEGDLNEDEYLNNQNDSVIDLIGVGRLIFVGIFLFMIVLFFIIVSIS